MFDRQRTCQFVNVAAKATSANTILIAVIEKFLVTNAATNQEGLEPFFLIADSGSPDESPRNNLKTR